MSVAMSIERCTLHGKVNVEVLGIESDSGGWPYATVRFEGDPGLHKLYAGDKLAVASTLHLVPGKSWWRWFE